MEIEIPDPVITSTTFRNGDNYHTEISVFGEVVFTHTSVHGVDLDEWDYQIMSYGEAENVARKAFAARLKEVLG